MTNRCSAWKYSPQVEAAPAQLHPFEQEQGALGIRAGGPGLQQQMQPLPRNAQDARQLRLVAAPPQKLGRRRRESVPMWSPRPGLENLAPGLAWAHPPQFSHPVNRQLRRDDCGGPNQREVVLESERQAWHAATVVRPAKRVIPKVTARLPQFWGEGCHLMNDMWAWDGRVGRTTEGLSSNG